MNPVKRLLVLLPTILVASCTPQPTLEVPEEFKPGQQYFHKICSNCHGPDAMGKQTQAPRLIDVDYLPENFSDDDIRETIINGTDKMPPQKNKISEQEIQEIIKYLRYSQQAAGLTAEEELDEEEEENITTSDPG
ncbi:MAG: c-type cytochrome [Nitrospinales bacterium]